MPFVKMIFSANRPPMTRDQSNAFFERWIIIPFETVYEIQPTAASGDHRLEAFLVPSNTQEIRIEVRCDWIDFTSARSWEARSEAASA
jgi:phage/plasmid-associated DNA primase